MTEPWTDVAAIVRDATAEFQIEADRLRAENERLRAAVKLKDSQLANCHAEIVKLRDQLISL